MKIEQWSLSRIKPYENNPRLNDDAVDAVATSLREFGFRQSIAVDAEGVIICGHTRYKAAQKLGLEKVPVHVAKDLSPEQIRACRIADNQTASLAEWDLGLAVLQDLLRRQSQSHETGKVQFDRKDLRSTSMNCGFGDLPMLAQPVAELLRKQSQFPPRALATIHENSSLRQAFERLPMNRGNPGIIGKPGLRFP